MDKIITCELQRLVIWSFVQRYTPVQTLLPSAQATSGLGRDGPISFQFVQRLLRRDDGLPLQYGSGVRLTMLASAIAKIEACMLRRLYLQQNSRMYRSWCQGLSL